MSDHIEHACDHCGSLLCPSTRCLKTSRVVEPDYQARAEQAKRDEEKKRAAVVADSPELAQARERIAVEAEAARERWTNSLTTDGHAYRRAVDEAETVGAELRRVDVEHRKALIGIDDARERIAALEADTAGYRADLAALEVRHSRMVDAGVELGAALTEALRRGDAALARVRELEAKADKASVARLAAYVERCAAECDHAEWEAAYSSLALGLRQIERGEATLDDGPLGRALVTEAAAQPKPRDESQPPPGWESYSFRDGDGVLCDSMYLRRKPGNPLPVEAWRIYDAEHGYAPPDEAAIRADERRRTELDIAAELLRLSNDGGCSWCGEQWSEAVAKSDYPREET